MKCSAQAMRAIVPALMAKLNNFFYDVNLKYDLKEDYQYI